MEYANVNPNEIGRTLRCLRNGKGLTQHALAERLKISPATVAMYETGRRVPTDNLKVQIANFYGVPIERIFYAQEQHDS